MLEPQVQAVEFAIVPLIPYSGVGSRADELEWHLRNTVDRVKAELFWTTFYTNLPPLGTWERLDALHILLHSVAMREISKADPVAYTGFTKLWGIPVIDYYDTKVGYSETLATMFKQQPGNMLVLHRKGMSDA